MTTIIQTITTSKGNKVDILFNISNGIIKRISLDNKGEKILSSDKILRLKLPEIYDKNKPIIGIGKKFFAIRKKITIDELVIPDSFSIIEDLAFYKSEVNKVIWPASVKRIPKECFSHSKLTKIDNINSITEIANGAFLHCHNLKELYLPDNIKSIQEEAFCFSSIEYIRWPSNVHTIPKLCFASSDIRLLENIDNLDVIEEDAFHFCDKLKTFIIPDNISVIGNHAFYNSGIEKCRWPSNCKIIPCACFMSSSLEAITNIDGCTKIDKEAFCETKLKKISWPSHITTIADSTFCCCQFLEEISGIDNVTSIGNNAFSSTNFISFDWPKKCCSIPNDVFWGCDNLKNIYGINNVTSIGNNAFAHCTSLESFVWPEKCHTISENCFRNCISLSSIDIKKEISIIKVEENAFLQTKIKKLDLSFLTYCIINDKSINVTYPYYSI